MSNEITCVYIAGALRPKGHRSQCAWIDYLLNTRENIKHAVSAAKAGFTPFCPALDFLYILVGVGTHRLTESTIMRMSKDWLERCDAVVLTPKWQRSEGTLAEIKRAEQLGIPVFKSLKKLIEHVKEEE